MVVNSATVGRSLFHKEKGINHLICQIAIKMYVKIRVNRRISIRSFTAVFFFRRTVAFLASGCGGNGAGFVADSA